MIVQPSEWRTLNDANSVVWCPFLFLLERVLYMQLAFLPEIDREKTRKNVEAALEQYRIMLLMNPEEYEPKVTSSLKLIPSAPTNEFHSSTEDVAIKRTDMEIKRNEFIKRILRAVNRLSYQERSIIINRYLTGEDTFDYEIYNELGFSESKYYRIKSDAFYKLAFILRIVVYKEEGEVV